MTMHDPVIVGAIAAAVGVALGATKDIVVKILDLRSTRERRELENKSLRIDIENKSVTVIRSLPPMILIHRIDADGVTEIDDALVIEEPLEIRVNDRAVSVTMRTPGEDFDLAAGFLFTESILRSADEVAELRHWGSPNVVRVALRDGVRVDLARLQRNFYSASSCGVCGKASIDAIRVHAAAIGRKLRVEKEVILDLPAKLREAQKTFDTTGAIHGAGIFDASGELLRAREDVGRHNAVDKVIGSFFRDGETTSEKILVVSGRASFEIVQKAIVARIPVLAAVGAPSTLAVDLAREMGLTLYGFVRDGRFNAYA